MKPAPFAYHRPSTVEQSLELLAQHGYDAKVLAGGQSLIPTMNFRLALPAILVDLNGVSELDYMKESAGGLRIGAMTRQRAVERHEAAARAAPLLYETIPFIAHPQIRNRGTIGGSLAHADPAAELPAVMLALDATFHLRSRHGTRSLRASEFFTGLFMTALATEELLAEIEIPAPPPRSGWAFQEVARRHGDYALVGVAVWLTLEAKGTCETARIALLSVGEGPVVARGAAAVLQGAAPDADAIREAAEAAATADIDPPSDIHASAAYRRQLTRVLVGRALSTAVKRASGER